MILMGRSKPNHQPLDKWSARASKPDVCLNLDEHPFCRLSTQRIITRLDSAAKLLFRFVMICLAWINVKHVMPMWNEKPTWHTWQTDHCLRSSVGTGDHEFVEGLAFNPSFAVVPWPVKICLYDKNRQDDKILYYYFYVQYIQYML